MEATNEAYATFPDELPHKNKNKYVLMMSVPSVDFGAYHEDNDEAPTETSDAPTATYEAESATSDAPTATS